MWVERKQEHHQSTAISIGDPTPMQEQEHHQSTAVSIGDPTPMQEQVCTEMQRLTQLQCAAIDILRASRPRFNRTRKSKPARTELQGQQQCTTSIGDPPLTIGQARTEQVQARTELQAVSIGDPPPMQWQMRGQAVSIGDPPPMQWQMRGQAVSIGDPPPMQWQARTIADQARTELQRRYQRAVDQQQVAMIRTTVQRQQQIAMKKQALSNEYLQQQQQQQQALTNGFLQQQELIGQQRWALTQMERTSGTLSPTRSLSEQGAQQVLQLQRTCQEALYSLPPGNYDYIADQLPVSPSLPMIFLINCWQPSNSYELSSSLEIGILDYILADFSARGKILCKENGVLRSLRQLEARLHIRLLMCEMTRCGKAWIQRIVLPPRPGLVVNGMNGNSVSPAFGMPPPTSRPPAFRELPYQGPTNRGPSPNRQPVCLPLPPNQPALRLAPPPLPPNQPALQMSPLPPPLPPTFPTGNIA
jgi:hypothetical protein